MVRGGEELGELEKGKTIIRIYYIKKSTLKILRIMV